MQKSSAIGAEDMCAICLDAQFQLFARFGGDVAMYTYHHRPKSFDLSVDIRVRPQLLDNVGNSGQLAAGNIHNCDMFRAYAQFDCSVCVCQIRQCQKRRQANLSKLARVRQTEQMILRSARRNAIEYLGMIKRLEARKGYRKLLRKRERAASGGLGLFGTLGMILAINDFQKMAHGIDKLAKKK